MNCKLFVTELLNIGNQNIEKYRLKVVAAAEWTANNVTSLYSSIFIHSPAFALNLVTNTLLNVFKNGSSIIVINHPLTKEISVINFIYFLFVLISLIICINFRF